MGREASSCPNKRHPAQIAQAHDKDTWRIIVWPTHHALTWNDLNRRVQSMILCTSRWEVDRFRNHRCLLRHRSSTATAAAMWPQVQHARAMSDGIGRLVSDADVDTVRRRSPKASESKIFSGRMEQNSQSRGRRLRGGIPEGSSVVSTSKQSDG